jgi:hypothetical protein
MLSPYRIAPIEKYPLPDVILIFQSRYLYYMASEWELIFFHEYVI